MIQCVSVAVWRKAKRYAENPVRWKCNNLTVSDSSHGTSIKRKESILSRLRPERFACIFKFFAKKKYLYSVESLFESFPLDMDEKMLSSQKVTCFKTKLFLNNLNSSSINFIIFQYFIYENIIFKFIILYHRHIPKADLIKS